MKVKLFTKRRSFRGKPEAQFERLESEINSWLAAHPNVVIEHVHKMSEPTLGQGGQLAVAIWYRNGDAA